MSERLDIVCHAFPSWRGDYMKSTIQLMKELAVRHTVLYIDYAYSLKDILVNRRHNKYIPVKRILGIEDSLEMVQLENGGVLYVLSLPPVIPFNWINQSTLYNIVQGLNGFLIKGRIQSALTFLSMNHPIVINAFNPFFGHVSLNLKLIHPTIYYCYDNIGASQWASKHGERLEQHFMNEVNAVIFTSKALQTAKAVGGTDSYVVSNGVDLSLFEGQSDLKSMTENKNICIGYVGTVDDRLDYDLLEKMIEDHPAWTFQFIGRINDTRAEALSRFSNVHLTGAVDIHELPAMMKQFTAGIIPFVKNDFTRSIYPMKANEYLILGMPVVMTDFASLSDLEDVVSVTDAENFVDRLQEEIRNDNAEKRAKRVQRATGNSWKKKAEEFEKILYQYA